MDKVQELDDLDDLDGTDFQGPHPQDTDAETGPENLDFLQFHFLSENVNVRDGRCFINCFKTYVFRAPAIKNLHLDCFLVRIFLLLRRTNALVNTNVWACTGTLRSEVVEVF